MMTPGFGKNLRYNAEHYLWGQEPYKAAILKMFVEEAAAGAYRDRAMRGRGEAASI